ncbi:hypothetical protein FIBSPDRAFT_880036 [Athelia psychrophila]|uniref:Uncharacterized protein n=1 Tax=Athelia psychrophila TaxID=1759441 RepID=A0A167TB10_9AGAM|nr:hypothetical protein FIBSPDRAFT_880036 [Fibularhizoctonia sp. CBS 109695]
MRGGWIESGSVNAEGGSDGRTVEGPVQGYAFVAFLVRSPATHVSSSCSKINDPTGGLVPPVTSFRSHRTVFRAYRRRWKRR